MTELKPCPFCENRPIHKLNFPKLVSCVTEMCPLDDHYIILDDWQDRPGEDVLKAELAEKDAEIERLRLCILRGLNGDPKTQDDIDVGMEITEAVLQGESDD